VRGRRPVVALALAVLGACSPGSDGAPFEVPGEPVATNEVELPRSYRFEPAVIEIEAGTTVTWTNNDQFPHTIHLLSRSEVDEPVAIGESVSITFDQPGTIYYDCSLHPQQMHGKIIVR
jgi:plastocyanin